jgi:23S rRNA (uracil1939-C5)-methyltransferase
MSPNPGDRLELTVDKPAAGGRMIARHEGRVFFVLGAIPGERVSTVVEKVERQLAFATVTEILEPSPDRRPPSGDPLCGGCLYAHIAYPAQLRVKAAVVEDAFRRLARIDPPAVDVQASPEAAYRMRARLHVHEGVAGFYREGSHTICDAAQTQQLSAKAVEAAVDAAARLRGAGVNRGSVQVSENIAGDQRALHIEIDTDQAMPHEWLEQVTDACGLTGCTLRNRDTLASAGVPRVDDPLQVITGGRAGSGVLGRSPEAFFQANRFLLPALAQAVLDAAPDGTVLDLYAGVGLFSVSLAAVGRSGITAVEGSPISADDLRSNAAPFGTAVRVRQASVEDFLRSRPRTAATVIVDPPRTGMSREAMQAMIAHGAGSVVYVSCDPPTMARDARRLVDNGYAIESLRAFDLFPNTPHVECLAVFTRR